MSDYYMAYVLILTGIQHSIHISIIMIIYHMKQITIFVMNCYTVYNHVTSSFSIVCVLLLRCLVFYIVIIWQEGDKQRILLWPV